MKKGILFENTMNIMTNEMKVSLKINKMVAGNLWVKENIKELEKLNYYKKQLYKSVKKFLLKGK